MARRRKHFGSPPAVHRKEAGRILGSMRRAKAEFDRHLRSGQCTAALSAMLRVEALGSAAFREKLATGMRRAWGTKRSVRAPMHRRFLMKCNVTPAR